MDVNLNMTGMNITNISYAFFGNNSVDTYLFRSVASVLTLNSHLIASGGWVNSTSVNVTNIYVSDDVQLLRGAANRLDLASGDSFNLVSGAISIGGTNVIDSSRNIIASTWVNSTNFNATNIYISDDTQLLRGAANRLDLASGDSFNLVSGSILFGGLTVIDSSRNINGTWINGTNLNASSDINGTRLFQGTSQVIDTLSATTDETTVSKSGGTVTIGIADPLVVGKGGTGTATAFTTGSVVFAGGSGVYTQDNANLFWDDTNNRLGIGTASPASLLHLSGSNSNAMLNISNGTNSVLFVNGTLERVGIGTTSPSQLLSLGSNDHVFSATAGGEVAFNDVSKDINFRVESDGDENMLFVDAGINSVGFGLAPTTEAGMWFDNTARTVTGGYARVRLNNNGAITTDTTGNQFSMLLYEPNIVVGSGTPANAATLYVVNAPTEATSNYALWVDGGLSRFDGGINITAGGLNVTTGDVLLGVTSGNVGIGTATIASSVRLNISGGDLAVGNLASCDTIDTTANGTFICGSDATVASATGWTLSGSTLYNNTAGVLVGIGTSTPGATLNITSTNNAGAFDIVNGTTGTHLLFVNATTGNIGIGTASPSFTLDVRGNINSTQDANATRLFQGANQVIDTLSATTDETTVSKSGGTVTIGIADPLIVGKGGTGTATAFTTGSVVFAGGSGVYTQDNANLFWDDTNNRLGIGTTSLGNATLNISLTHGTGLAVFNSTTASHIFLVNSTSGQVGIGFNTTSGNYLLNVRGDINGTWVNATYLNASSDINGTRLFQGANQVIDTLSATTDETTVSKSGGTVTIGIADPLVVGKGGTGVASLTDGGILLGSGTAAVTVTAQPTNGQLLIGSTGADPVLATLTGTSNQITVSNGAGSITLSTPQDIATGSTPTFAGLITTGNINVRGAITNTTHVNASSWINGTNLNASSDINGTRLFQGANQVIDTLSATTDETTVSKSGGTVTIGIADPLIVGKGGTGTATAFTTGSVVFAGGSGVYTQDNANLFWDDTNNRLGIGTTSPQSLLHISGSNNNAMLNISNGTNSVLFVNGTLERVGIGTTSPSGILHVRGNSTTLITGQESNGRQLTVENWAGTDYFNVDTVNALVQTVNGADLLGYTDAYSTGAYRLDGAGSGGTSYILSNVGIGTTTIASSVRLNISGGDLAVGNLASCNTIDTTANGTFICGTDTGGANNMTGAGTAGYIPQWENATALNNSNIFQLGSNVGIGTTSPNAVLNITTSASASDVQTALDIVNGTTGAHLLFVNDTTGNVGIGTAAPAAKLDVSGTVRSIGFEAPSTGTGLELFYSSDTAYVQGYDRTGVAFKPIRIRGSQLNFDTSTGTAKMTILTGGNVGIGTESPSTLLDVRGGINASQINITGSGTLLNVSNRTHSQLYVNDTGIGYVIIQQGRVGIGTASPGNTLDVSGSIRSSRAPGDNNYEFYDTTGSAIRWVQYLSSDGLDLKFYDSADRVTFKGGGNVGIGTTTPNALLHVMGNATINGSLYVNDTIWQPVYPSDDGLVLYLPFSEGTGTTTYDKSPYGNDGTLANKTSVTCFTNGGCPSWEVNPNGKYGRALYFNETRSGDIVDLGTPSTLQSLYNFTVSVWVNPRLDGWEVIMAQDDGGGVDAGEFILRLDDTSGIDVYLDGLTASLSDVGRPLAGWNHVAVSVVNNSRMDVYLNGLLVGSDTGIGTTAPYLHSGSNLRIGGDSSTAGSGFNGTIDEVRIYNRTLSLDEIRTQYLEGLQSHGSIVADRFRVVNTSANKIFEVNRTRLEYDTSKLVVDASGNVGIGTTSPQSLLQVNSTTANVYIQLPVNNTAVASADCDNQAEVGRSIVSFNVTSTYLYVCSIQGGSTIGWRTIATTG